MKKVWGFHVSKINSKKLALCKSMGLYSSVGRATQCRHSWGHGFRCRWSPILFCFFFFSFMFELILNLQFNQTVTTTAMIISSFRLSFVTDTSLRGEPRPLPNVIKRKFNLGLKLYFCSIVTSFKAFILGLPITNDGINPLHVRESRLRNLGKFCLWNTKSWALDSGIQLKESGIPLTIGIQNRSSTDRQRLESST